jgi:hypothetical protein
VCLVLIKKGVDVIQITRQDIERDRKKTNVELDVVNFSDALALARYYGLTFTTMIRGWIIERIRSEKIKIKSAGGDLHYEQTSLFTKTRRKTK